MDALHKALGLAPDVDPIQTCKDLGAKMQPPNKDQRTLTNQTAAGADRPALPPQGHGASPRTELPFVLQKQCDAEGTDDGLHLNGCHAFTTTSSVPWPTGLGSRLGADRDISTQGIRGFHEHCALSCCNAGYILSFYFFGRSMRALPMGLAYALWSGLGMLIATVIGIVLFSETLHATGAIGIGMLIRGVTLLNSSPEAE